MLKPPQKLMKWEKELKLHEEAYNKNRGFGGWRSWKSFTDLCIIDNNKKQGYTA